MADSSTEKISAIFSRVELSLERARTARNKEKQEQKRVMLAGKVKAYTEVLCLIHDKYPNNLQPGLWKGSITKR